MLASATDLRIITRAIALLISVVSVLGDWLSSCAHKDAHAVCAPGLINTAVRVGVHSPPHVPSQAGNEPSEYLETLFVSFPCINSHLS